MSAIEKAVELLRENADSLREAHTINDDWRGDPAQVAYCELIAAADAAIEERDALRAESASWEQQASDRTDDAVQFAQERDALKAELDALRQGTAMDRSVDKAWARFAGAFGNGPEAPYPGMIEAFENHYGQSFRDKDWRSEAACWAAAWHKAVVRPVPPATSAPAEQCCPLCGGVMRIYSRCRNVECEAVTITLEQARYNKLRSFMQTVATQMEDQPAQSVPDKLTPSGNYDIQHHYAQGWNDAIDEALAAATKTDAK